MKRLLSKNQFRWAIITLVIINLAIIIPFKIIFHNSTLYTPSEYFLFFINAIVFGLLFQLRDAMFLNSIAIIINITAEYWNNLLGIYVVQVDGKDVPAYILFLSGTIQFFAATVFSFLLILLIQKIKRKYIVEKHIDKKLSEIGKY